VSYNPYSARKPGDSEGDVDRWMALNIRVCSGDEYERYKNYLTGPASAENRISGHAPYDGWNWGVECQE